MTLLSSGWPGRSGQYAAAQAGHGVDVCEMYYARTFRAARRQRFGATPATTRRGVATPGLCTAGAGTFGG
jgi:hypothetical protein